MTTNTKSIDQIKDGIINKESVTTPEIKQLSDALKGIATLDISEIDSQFESWLNDLTFSQLIEGIKNLSPNNDNERAILKDLVINLWKYDEKADYINKSPKEYNDLLISIVWSWSQDYTEAKSNYDNINKKYEKSQEKLLKYQKISEEFNLIDKRLLNNSNEIADSDFIEYFKSQLWDDVQNIDFKTRNHCLNYLNKEISAIENDIKSANTSLKKVKQELEKEKWLLLKNSELTQIITQLNWLDNNQITSEVVNQGITVDQYLNTSNDLNKKEVRDSMIEEPQYNDAFNKIFELGYKEELKSEQEKKFYKILWAKDWDIVNFFVVDKYSSKSNISNDKWLSVYPQWTKVIRIETNISNEKTKYEYITFGKQFELDKILSKWFNENKKEIVSLFSSEENINKIFKSVPEGDKSEFEQFKWKLQISAYGGPEALPVLFDYQKEEKKPFINYLKKEGKLKMVLDSFLKNPIVEESLQWQYFVKIFEWIKLDKDLTIKYLDLIEDVNSPYLWNDIVTKNTIISWLAAFRNTSLNKDTDSDKWSKIASFESDSKIMFTEEVAKGSLVDNIKKHISVLFQHPYGQMILGLLDNFFGGKWWLMKLLWWPDSPFRQELNKQFQNYYALKWDQMNLLKSISLGDNNKELAFMKDKSLNQDVYNESFGIIANSFVDKSVNNNAIVDKFCNKENLSLLDGNHLEKRYKELKSTTPHSKLFKKDWDKFIINTDKESRNDVKDFLSKVIADPKTSEDIRVADRKIKSNKALFGDINHNWIIDSNGYAKAVSAYLMGGSKWDKFHYVISETWNNWIDEAKISEAAEAQANNDKFDTNIASLEKNIKNIATPPAFDYKNSQTPYAYEAKTTSPKTDYQTKILEPMSDLFDIKKVPLITGKSNFDLLLDTFDKEIDITKIDFFKDPYHLRNMMVFMNKWKTQNPQFLDDVINAMVTMTNVEKKGNNFVFSNIEWNTIELSNSENKLTAEYFAKTKETKEAKEATT